MKLSPLVLLAASGAAPALADEWDTLRAGLDAWAALSFDANFVVNIGTAEGRLLAYSPDGFSMDEHMLGASVSKWGTGIVISGLVAEGTLAYDDLANKYLDWWATEPTDPRSNVTIADLLSFTGGFNTDTSQAYDCGDITDYMTCAQASYNASTGYVHPRTGWAYSACQIQFAGAIAQAATNKPVQTLLQEYLYTPYNMKNTFYGPLDNPSLAVGINTTGTDIEQFLAGMLAYKGAPKAVLDVAEQDWTQGLHPEGDDWFGHYSLGHYWECLGWGIPGGTSGPVSQDCIELNIQAGPGELGMYPLLDRSGGGDQAGPIRPAHYFSLVIAEPDALSGVPEYLRIIAKPVSDLILNGTDPTTVPNEQILAAGGGLLRRDIEYIATELLTCTCSEVPTTAGEPFNSLLKNLPADQPKVNRRDLLKQGAGISLLDVIDIQKTLGNCTCKGREQAMKQQAEKPDDALPRFRFRHPKL